MGRRGKFFVIGNWKRLDSLDKLGELVSCLNQNAHRLEDTEVVCAPPFIFLDRIKTAMSFPYSTAAQDCWIHGPAKPCTGEVTANMLASLHVPWVLLGHSDRRQKCGETNKTAACKVAHALSCGLRVVACIGETLEERQKGVVTKVLQEQLMAYKSQVTDWSRVVIAYEPVWATGTGVVASPEQAQEVLSSVRGWAEQNLDVDVESLRIIYGGSVNADNCEDLAACHDVDGFLVGAASLQGPDFVTICNSHRSTDKALFSQSTEP